MKKIILLLNRIIKHRIIKKILGLDTRDITLAEKMDKSYSYRGYDDEENAVKAIDVVKNYTMCTYENLVTLWQQVRYVDNARIPGCMIECGTWKGGTSGMMALSHMNSGAPKRELHLFDSFEGLPQPKGEKDSELAVKYADYRASGKLKSIGKCVGSLEENQQLIGNIICYPKQLIFYHVGWF